MDAQKPSIGRIVIYNHSGSKDGKFAPMQSPAIVQKVNEDESLNLVVFSNSDGLFFPKNVSLALYSHPAEEPEAAENRILENGSSWEWPKRV